MFDFKVRTKDNDHFPSFNVIVLFSVIQLILPFYLEVQGTVYSMHSMPFPMMYILRQYYCRCIWLYSCTLNPTLLSIQSCDPCKATLIFQKMAPPIICTIINNEKSMLFSTTDWIFLSLKHLLHFLLHKWWRLKNDPTLHKIHCYLFILSF